MIIMKIQKYLSNSGICSRRKGEKYILEKRIKINNKLANIGDLINSDKDKIYFDKKIIKNYLKKEYIVLNKPRGYISTTNDPRNRKTVLSLVSKIKSKLYPIGRLDYRTEGLIILTNDGDLAYKISHPKHKIPKTYKIRCSKRITKKDFYSLEEGVLIENKYISRAFDVKLLENNKDSSLIELTIYDGKNKQIRKMFEHLGYVVTRLVRISIGLITIENLKTGNFRLLKKNELNYLNNIK